LTYLCNTNQTFRVLKVNCIGLVFPQLVISRKSMRHDTFRKFQVARTEPNINRAMQDADKFVRTQIALAVQIMMLQG